MPVEERDSIGGDVEGEAPSVEFHEGLREQRPLLQSILDHVLDGLVVTDLHGGFLFFNPSAARILGMGPLEVPMSAWPEVYGLFCDDEATPYPPANLPLARAVNGETVHDQLIFVRNPKLAKGAWISVNATPWRDADGTTLGAIASFRDVTALRESSELATRLSNAVEQTADSVLITNTDGDIQYVNPAFERTTGYTRAELLGRTPRVLRSGKHGSQFYADMWATLISGHTFQGLLINRKKNGELYHAAQTITPMRDNEGRTTHFVSVIRDLTEKMAAFEAAAEMQVARRVQQRLYPQASPTVGVEIAGHSLASALMCGDYYDYFRVRDHELGLVVGDVSGHGLGQAMVMVETRAWLHSGIHAWTTPSEALSRLNAALLQDLRSSHFVTMLLATVDVRDRTLTYSNAGHPPGYLVDSSGKTKLVLESTGIPLGILPDVRGLSHTTVAMEPGDLVVLLTDGFLESPRPDGEFMDVEDLLAVIRELRDAPVQEILDGLYERLRLFVQGQTPIDDVTAIVCRMPVP